MLPEKVDATVNKKREREARIQSSSQVCTIFLYISYHPGVGILGTPGPIKDLERKRSTKIQSLLDYSN